MSTTPAMTAVDHFSRARELNARAAPRDVSATLSALADIQQRMSRYGVRRADGTVQIDRTGLLAAWSEVVSRAQEIQEALASPSSASRGIEAIEQLAHSVADIAEELRGARGGAR